MSDKLSIGFTGRCDFTSFLTFHIFFCSFLSYLTNMTVTNTPMRPNTKAKGANPLRTDNKDSIAQLATDAARSSESE